MPRLPPEIIRLIISEVDKTPPNAYRTTLWALANACSAFHAQAIEFLYKHIHIAERHQVVLLVRTLSDSSQLAGLVASIRVQSRDPSLHWDMLDPLPARASANLIALHSIEFVSERLVALRQRDWSFICSFIRVIWSSRLRYCADDTLATIVPAISSSSVNCDRLLRASVLC